MAGSHYVTNLLPMKDFGQYLAKLWTRVLQSYPLFWNTLYVDRGLTVQRHMRGIFPAVRFTRFDRCPRCSAWPG